VHSGQSSPRDLIALSITVRDCPKFGHVAHNHLMAEVLDLLASPDRVCISFHRNQCSTNIPEALGDAGGVGPESTSINNFAVFVQGAVMVPDVPKSIPIVFPAHSVLRELFEMKNCGCFFLRIVSLVSQETFSSQRSVRSSRWTGSGHSPALKARKVRFPATTMGASPIMPSTSMARG
jgi:hypothetical protein